MSKGEKNPFLVISHDKDVKKPQSEEYKNNCRMMKEQMLQALKKYDKPSRKAGYARKNGGNAVKGNE